MRKLLAILLIIVLLSQPVYSNPQEEPVWTLVFYMGGVGDLSEFVDIDLADLMSVDLGDVSIIVLADQKDVGDSRLIEISGGDHVELPLSSVNSSWVDEVDMSDPNTLSDFVRWTKANYASKRYMLTLWGHGNGWRGMSMEEGRLLTLADMRSALYGLNFDIIGFDSCTMGMIEVYHELAGNADLMIASEKEEPISGWPYGRILEAFKLETSMSPEDLSTLIVDTFVDWGAVNTGVSTTLTVVDTNDLPMAELDIFAEELMAVLPFYLPDVRRAQEDTESYMPFPNPRDLYHFTLNINEYIPVTRLDMAGAELRRAMNHSIIHHRVSVVDRDPVENVHGLGIYLPSERLHEGYTELAFSHTLWYEWLDLFVSHPGTPFEVDLEMNVSVGEGWMSVDIHHDALEGDPYIGIFNGSEYRLHNVTSVFYEGLGDHLVEGFVVHDGGMLVHSRQEVAINRSFTILGTLDSPGPTQLDVLNSRTDTWYNFTIAPGDYSISLNVPYGCKENDTLQLTYAWGDHTVVREVTVEGTFTVSNVTISCCESPPSYRILALPLAIVLIAVVWFLKRKQLGDSGPS